MYKILWEDMTVWTGPDDVLVKWTWDWILPAYEAVLQYMRHPWVKDLKTFVHRYKESINMFSHAYSSRFYSDSVRSKQLLTSCSCMSFLHPGIKGTNHKTACVWGRGLTRARVAAVVSVSAQHGCHSGFVSWWNRVPESCLWMTAGMGFWYRAP